MILPAATRDFLFRCRWLFKGVPVSIDGKRFRLDESLRRWSFEVEPELRDALRKNLHEGNIVIDAGANFGLHTIYAATLIGATGHIHAFEPVPTNLHFLRRNLRLNHLENRVTVVPSALSDSADSFIEMSIPSDNVAVSAAISKAGKEGETLVKVKNLRLDAYVMEKKLRPHLIKIDVEGAEHEVLKGAEKILIQYRPVLVVEVHQFALPLFGSSPEALCDYLVTLGYKQYQIAHTKGIAGDYYHAVFLPTT